MLVGGVGEVGCSHLAREHPECVFFLSITVVDSEVFSWLICHNKIILRLPILGKGKIITSSVFQKPSDTKHVSKTVLYVLP